MITEKRVRVTVHRQGDCRMTSQSLRHLGMQASAGQIRYERVPQAVEVGHQARVISIDDASRCQIAAEHVVRVRASSAQRTALAATSSP